MEVVDDLAFVTSLDASVVNTSSKTSTVESLVVDELVVASVGIASVDTSMIDGSVVDISVDASVVVAFFTVMVVVASDFVGGANNYKIRTTFIQCKTKQQT